MASPFWSDRRQAGLALADALQRRAPIPAPRAVVGLPRGGVIVAAPVAEALGAPLYSWAVRKLARVDSPEVAIGAVAPGLAGPVVIWASPEQQPAGCTRAERLALVAEQWRELQRRQGLYGDPPGERLRGLWLVVVDDGLATGLTMRAALASLRQLHPRGLVLAVPVADPAVLEELRPLVDVLVVLQAVRPLEAVGCHYGRFEAVEDHQVLEALAASRRRCPESIP